MKSCREMRADAWRALTGKGWFWRVFASLAVLQAAAQIAASALSSAFARCEVQTWSDFAMAKIKAFQAGLDYTVPSVAVAWRMTGATAFHTFIIYIFGAIVAFGVASVSLKAANDCRDRWFADSMAGFRRPISLAWLMLLMNLKVMLWSLLFMFPGIVAAYRYRQAWFVKSENPDWSASKCIAESGRMMRGFKWKAFVFDLSYIGWLFAVSASFLPAVVLPAVFGTSPAVMLVVAVASGCAMGLVFFAACYFVAGRAVFYRELAAERPSAPSAETPAQP